MSERTTIGGTVYETVGSSSSNLLLKCNGTARIQWGNKLIDLVKNGKIAAGDSSTQVSVVTSESDIRHEGIYILTADSDLQLWVYKDGEKYNLTGTDLYISASNKQEITAEQREMAQSNIGMCFDTLEALTDSGIQNGIAYVISDKTLYTIQGGVIGEFEAKLKTVTVEQEEEQGEVISSSIQIVLSVLDDEYLVLSNRTIKANYDIVLKDTAKIMSEGATDKYGYRLYTNGETSILEVDTIKVRNGLPIEEYTETTIDELRELATSNSMKPHTWYLITDYVNHWKLVKSDYNYRPILVKALNGNTLYNEGLLFEDQSITIKYDLHFEEVLIQRPDNQDETEVYARGRIYWMKDACNNEANFDFLDYVDCYGNPIATQHSYSENSSLKSIFPTGSYNNKLTAYDLPYLSIQDKELVTSDSVTASVDFQTDAIMHDNVITCKGFTIKPSCTNFYGNSLNEVCKFSISHDFINNTFNLCYYKPNWELIESFESVHDYIHIYEVEFENEVINTSITNSADNHFHGGLRNVSFEKLHKSHLWYDIQDCKFGEVSVLHAAVTINNCKFKNISNCAFGDQDVNVVGDMSNVICDVDLNIGASEDDASDHGFYPVGSISLCDNDAKKAVYKKNDLFYIVDLDEQYFHKGMIMMHSGAEPIPYGWAICDGGTYTHNGVQTTTPNLSGRFIKAVVSSSDVGESSNLDVDSDNKITITQDNLPQHNHPHQEHTHSISQITGSIENSGDLTLNFSGGSSVKEVTQNEPTSVVISVTGEGVTTESSDIYSLISVNTSDVTGSVTGGNHTHNLSISGGQLETSTSVESDKTWANTPIKIEPNYYSLIFIMKL